ncbi:hypothetical protein ISF_02835 [Cordyceps fumosorosea ARSEF 2679]|uniref:NAD dependent epimerase/dehydratase n=1 Tax=Cordyceps fumosorosea (strain ARSEF 2679) TaxID=1081104 RepID=A0A168B3C7_CORFA|nr:hypothetical protein ISF_02835 [Cordyceps fumosorosea ARSEF 2679]OAA69565.1 hypothetical protein ISF_02835 [Cordyceps fumosorosea ARSEF 2679]
MATTIYPGESPSESSSAAEERMTASPDKAVISPIVTLVTTPSDTAAPGTPELDMPAPDSPLFKQLSVLSPEERKRVLETAHSRRVSIAEAIKAVEAEKREERLKGPGPILCLSMVRSGTASLAKALPELGVLKVHHGLLNIEDDKQWKILDRAADATFPNLKSYTGEPFTREQWDELLGDYDAVTDMASFYAVSLIKAYPNAKVIIYEREIESWHRSVKCIFGQWTEPVRRNLIKYIVPLSGSKCGSANFKMAKGWTNSTDSRDIHFNSRAAYVEHYKWIRENVPSHQLLDFNLEDGWGPLAEFLGVPAPEIEFPVINKKDDFEKQKRACEVAILKRIARRPLPNCLHFLIPNDDVINSLIDFLMQKDKGKDKGKGKGKEVDEGEKVDNADNADKEN